MKKTPNPLKISKAIECACFNTRKAARAVTQFFDDMLKPCGLRGTQFTLLVAVFLKDRPTVTRLAEALVMDRTTLTRDLKPLEKRGLIKILSGRDKRTRELEMTPRGRELLANAIPLWEKAQAHMVNGLGKKRWGTLLQDLSAVISLARMQ